MLCLGHSLSHGQASGLSAGVGGCLGAALATPAEELMERAQLWHGAVPGVRVSSTEQFARAGLAQPQLSVWVPGKMIQKGREEGKVPFEKWQGQQESCEGEAY